MTVLVSDSFNRANASTLGSTDSYSGGTTQTWSVLTGTFGISNNQAYISATSGGTDAAFVDSGVSDCTIDIDTNFASMSNSSSGAGRVHFRMSDINNRFTMSMGVGTTNTILYRVQSGTAYNIGNTTKYNYSNVTHVRVVLSGSSIQIFFNNNATADIVATDSFNQTVTKHGIGSYSSANVYFDNFQISGSGSSTTTYIGSGTSTGKSNLTSNETLILKSNNTSNGISSLTTSEQLISHQGTTYSGSGSSNGVSSLNTIESIINKSNGQSNGSSLLNTTETKSYSANGSSNGLSNVSSNDKVTYESSSNVHGQSTLTTDGHESLSAQGNTQGQSNIVTSEQFIGHATTSYSGMGISDGTSNITSSEKVIYKVVGVSSGYSNLASTNTITYHVEVVSDGLTNLTTTDTYWSSRQIVSTVYLQGERELNIYLTGKRVLDINMKGVI